jgi:hypothetical protein
LILSGSPNFDPPQMAAVTISPKTHKTEIHTAFSLALITLLPLCLKIKNLEAKKGICKAKSGINDRMKSLLGMKKCLILE